MSELDFERMLATFDWASTSIGPRSTWPKTLESYLALIKRSRRPKYVVWGEDFRFFYNEQFLPVMGAKHPWGFGRPMADVWPEVWNDVGSLVSTCIREGQSFYFQDRPFVLRRHGREELTYFDFSYTPVQDDAGAIAGLLCVLVERTRAAVTAEKLEAALRHLERMFQQAPGFICVTHGPHHVYALVNEAYQRITGRTQSEMVGKPIRDVLPEVEDQGFVAYLDRVFETGESFVGQALPVRMEQGEAQFTTRYVDFVHQPIVDCEGKVIGIFTEGSDVTNRVIAESNLLASERMFRHADAQKDRFLAMVSHELRNPLSSIHGAAQVLEHLVTDNGRAMKCIHTIARQSQHMRAIVEDLLDHARVAIGRIVLKYEDVDINEVIVTAVEQLRPKYQERGHDVRVVLSNAPACVAGDWTRLLQVVSNLLANSIRYTPPGGVIEVSSSAHAHFVQIVVEDNGMGIAPDLVPELFVPFMQANPSPDRADGGLGLGLPLVKALVDAHGGSIHPMSDGVGKGCRFTVDIPRSSTRATGEATV